jgi:hypothetical protein
MTSDSAETRARLARRRIREQLDGHEMTSRMCDCERCNLWREVDALLRAQDAERPTEGQPCQECEKLRAELLNVHEAMPACRLDRMQNATTLDVANETVSQLFRMQSRAEKAEAALAASQQAVAEQRKADFFAGYRTWPAISGDDTRAQRVFAEWVKPPAPAPSRGTQEER